MRIVVLWWVVIAAGCFSPAAERAVAPGPASSRFVVHEWGTFTSMAAADGTLLEGLHHEEERLPAFVHGRNTEATPTRPEDCPAKCLEAGARGGPLRGVTQKLETPVLYFYSDTPRAVAVEVGFPKGVISEWYPRATSYGPELGEWRELSGGHMRWDVTLAPGTMPALPAVAPGQPWALARGVGSTPLSAADEREDYVFYRGLGAFPLDLVATTTRDGALSLTNRSQQRVPAAFLMHVHEGGGALVPLGGLSAGQTLTVPLPMGGKERSLERFAADAKAQVHTALEAAGLTSREATAMVETWSKSYFQSSGTRVLYVVPREWTDALLPISIEPKPTELVRVLVGRLELFTASEEASVSARALAASRDGSGQRLVAELGRFAEPKLRRVCATGGAACGLISLTLAP